MNSENTDAQPLAGRVIVVTGAGRGLGAEYALLAARLGAKVVVNDLGRTLEGQDSGDSPADQVVGDIVAAGGMAISDAHDVTDFDQAAALIEKALKTFGSLDGVVNNAGVLRDRMLTNMSEQEWDDVIRVHLRGHFCMSRHAAAYWREQSKQSGPVDAVLIQTSSIAGLHGNQGQVNYATAKSGLASMAHSIHLELHQRYGVRSYAVAPSARTRLTIASPGAVDIVHRKLKNGFDYFNPANVAPFVAWLLSKGCPAPSGSVFGIEGDVIRRYDSWRVATTVRNHGQAWTFDAIEQASDALFAGSDRAFTPIAEVMAAEDASES